MLKDSSEVLYFVFVRFLNQLGFNKLYYYSLIFFKSEFHFAKKIYIRQQILYNARRNFKQVYLCKISSLWIKSRL